MGSKKLEKQKKWRLRGWFGHLFNSTWNKLTVSSIIIKRSGTARQPGTVVCGPWLLASEHVGFLGVAFATALHACEQQTTSTLLKTFFLLIRKEKRPNGRSISQQQIAVLLSFNARITYVDVDLQLAHRFLESAAQLMFGGFSMGCQALPPFNTKLHR